LAATIGWPVAAGERLKARVTPSYAQAPANVMVQAFIEPNPLNRAVSVAVDSESFYTSSVAELDGDRAPRTKRLTFSMVPAGSYTVRVTLFGADGERDHCELDLKVW